MHRNQTPDVHLRGEMEVVERHKVFLQQPREETEVHSIRKLAVKVSHLKRERDCCVCVCVWERGLKCERVS